MTPLLLAAALAAAQAAPAQSCGEALGPLYEGTDEAALPGQVDGATLAGRDALLALRRERGDALVTVRGGSFANADFRGARLHNVCFIETDLAGSDWRGAEAAGVGFVRADLTGARLAGARMPRLLLRAPALADADATGADFSGGRFDGGPAGAIENLRLDRADMRRFRFDCGITVGDGCPIEGPVSLRGADLTGAAISSWWAEPDFAGARIDRTEVALGQLAALRDADIAGPILVRGGEAVAELSAADHRALLPHLVDETEIGSPSFDCARAASRIEWMLCADAGSYLRPLDRQLAEIYRRALAVDPSVAAAQRAWIAARDRCPIDPEGHHSGCVAAAYERRKGELVAAIGRPDWARPGAYALFVDPPVTFADGFRDDPLYRRLLPVIVGAAWGRVAVRVNADGTIDARGESVGGNAHMCTLGGDGLAFDDRTGWYSGPHAARDQDPPQWRGRPMPVLLLWDDRAEVWQRGHVRLDDRYGDPRFSDYASCGMRAGFGEMVRVPLPQAEVRALFDSFAVDD